MKFIKTPKGLKMWVEKIGENFWVHINNQTLKIKKEISKSRLLKKTDHKFMPEMKAPHSGSISSIFVKENDLVQAGQGLIVLSAMKMEHTLRAESPARIQSILVKEGQFVESGQKILIFTPLS